MIERYLNIAREVIDLSLKQGAEQVSVSLANATSFQLEVRNIGIAAFPCFGTAVGFASIFSVAVELRGGAP